MQMIKYIGLDVHKNSISISTADEGRDAEVRYYGKIGHDMDQLMKVFRKFISNGFELRCVYEAGCCGYHLYRFLTGNGVKCVVVAPSKIPRKSGDRLKNDTRDSITLARLHRAGELTEVYVPTEEDEALRDLVRAREDAQNAHKKAKQQLTVFLLRYHIVFSGKSKWSKAYFNWLTTISMKHPGQQITLQDYIDTIHGCNDRVKMLTEQIRQLSKQSRLYPLIQALQAMRGMSLIVAATLAIQEHHLLMRSRICFPMPFQIIGGLYWYNTLGKTEKPKLLAKAYKKLETKWPEPARILSEKWHYSFSLLLLASQTSETAKSRTTAILSTSFPECPRSRQ